MRRRGPSLRQQAVDARKRELVALGASELLNHVSIAFGFEYPSSLKAVRHGVEVNVGVCRDWPGNSEDVLFALTPSQNSGRFPVVIEAFAIRSDGQINELTDNEWNNFS